MMALCLYTGDAAYAMNAIMRGQAADEEWVRILEPWIQLARSGLAKMPKRTQNRQSEHTLDDTKHEDSQLKIDTVYRADRTAPYFMPVFEKFKKGAVIKEDAFLSTTSVQGSYGGNVTRTITGVYGFGRSVYGLSQNKTENEILLPPGTQMKIDDIQSTPFAQPDANADPRTQNLYDVKCSLVQVPEAKDDNFKTTDGENVAADKLEGMLASMPENLL